MAYHVYLGDTELPVPPEKIDLKISGNNKTLTLINDGEINLLKVPGLSEISFEMLLPQCSIRLRTIPTAFNRQIIILTYWKILWWNANRFS